MSKLLYDPQHWREKAKDIRAQADGCASEIDGDMLSRVAAEYDQIANRAEEWRAEMLSKAAADYEQIVCSL
jgi:hypothetical protein